MLSSCMAGVLLLNRDVAVSGSLCGLSGQLHFINPQVGLFNRVFLHCAGADLML